MALVDPVKRLAYDRAWRAANPEKVRQYREKWNRNNREKMLESARKRAKKNHARQMRNLLEWRKANRERYMAWRRAWTARNRERVRALKRLGEQRRKARKVNAGPSDVTLEGWNEILRKYGYKCLRCFGGGKLCMDHIIPLSQGGPHTLANIQPLCRTCNAQKYITIVDYRGSYARTR